jgi:hypothetical protein
MGKPSINGPCPIAMLNNQRVSTVSRIRMRISRTRPNKMGIQRINGAKTKGWPRNLGGSLLFLEDGIPDWVIPCYPQALESRIFSSMAGHEIRLTVQGESHVSGMCEAKCSMDVGYKTYINQPEVDRPTLMDSVFSFLVQGPSFVARAFNGIHSG